MKWALMQKNKSTLHGFTQGEGCREEPPSVFHRARLVILVLCIPHYHTVSVYTSNFMLDLHHLATQVGHGNLL